MVEEFIIANMPKVEEAIPTNLVEKLKSSPGRKSE